MSIWAWHGEKSEAKYRKRRNCAMERNAEGAAGVVFGQAVSRVVPGEAAEASAVLAEVLQAGAEPGEVGDGGLERVSRNRIIPLPAGLREKLRVIHE